VASEGVYLGKIGYLTELGVTAVELMPVQQLDAHVASLAIDANGNPVVLETNGNLFEYTRAASRSSRHAPTAPG
jgi:pullulanase/glycogen debranching enzyme